MVSNKLVAIDTNVAIAVLNGDRKILSSLKKFDSITLPFTVCGELLFGAYNSSRTKSNLFLFRKFIQDCLILDSGLQVAENYAVIRKELKDKGKPIPENDIWIAATCMFHDVPIATFDKHFHFIKGIKFVRI